MKALSCLLFVCCAFALPVWESIGPYGGSFRALALAPSNEDIVYVISHEPGEKFPPKCFQSTDAGNSWSDLGLVSESLFVYSMAVDPTNSDIVYAGSKGRVYKSTNGGVTWTDNMLTYDSVMGLAVHPTIPSTIFAVGGGSPPDTNPTVRKSTNQGVDWTRVVLEDSIKGVTLCLALDSQNNDVIYVGGCKGTSVGPGRRPRIYKSTDGGSSFTLVYTSDSIAAVNAICVHPTNSNIVYASWRRKIIRSTDAGITWTDMGNCGNTIHSLATSPADPSVVYAGGDTTVFKSTDEGITWFDTYGNFHGGREIYGLAAKSTNADIVYAVQKRNNYENLSVHKTTNGGATWFESSQGITLANITGFAVAPSSPSDIFAAQRLIGCYKTTNDGDTWTKLPYTACSYVMDDFAFHNTSADTLFALEGWG